MYNFLVKRGQTLALGLGVLIIVIFLITVSSGLSSAGYDMSTDLNALDDADKADISFFNPTLILTIALAAACFVLAFVVFWVLNIVKFPKESMKFIAGFVVLLIIFGITYATANTDVTGKLAELVSRESLTDGTIQFITGGITVTLLLCGLAALIMVASEIRNAFK